MLGGAGVKGTLYALKGTLFVLKGTLFVLRGTVYVRGALGPEISRIVAHSDRNPGRCGPSLGAETIAKVCVWGAMGLGAPRNVQIWTATLTCGTTRRGTGRYNRERHAPLWPRP